MSPFVLLLLILKILGVGLHSTTSPTHPLTLLLSLNTCPCVPVSTGHSWNSQLQAWSVTEVSYSQTLSQVSQLCHVPSCGAS